MVEGALGAVKRALVGGGYADKDVQIFAKHEGKNYLRVGGICKDVNGDATCEIIYQEIDGQLTTQIGDENRPSNEACRRKVQTIIDELYKK